MDDEFDADWWTRYKADLQFRFDQQEILIRALAALRL